MAANNGTTVNGKKFTSNLGYYENGQFWRFREFAANITLPSRLAQHFLRAQDMNLTLSARNLKVWTKYTGEDPESNYSTSDVQNTLLAAVLIASALLESPPWKPDAPLLIESQLDALNSAGRQQVTACLAQQRSERRRGGVLGEDGLHHVTRRRVHEHLPADGHHLGDVVVAEQHRREPSR